MLFATESIIKGRRALYAQMEAATLTSEQAFLQALELDPSDAVALTILGQERIMAGDRAEAMEYAWRAATANPCAAAPWFALAASFGVENPVFLNGILELAALKSLRTDEGIEQFEEAFKATSAAADFSGGEEALEIMADRLYEQRQNEPEEVSERLRPYRLIDDVLEVAGDGLDHDLVDGILEDGARSVPLLIGVLRAMARESLPGNDLVPAAYSLALLGEIGDPAVLPDLVECYVVDDLDIQGSSSWAVKRIAVRRPEESLDVIRKTAVGAGALQRGRLAMALAVVPERPSRRDALLSLLDGLARFSKPERHDLFMAVALALEFTEDAKGRELAWSLLGRHAALLPKRTRGELREAFKIHAEMDRNESDSSEGSEATVYDLCGPLHSDGDGKEEADDDFNAAEEEDDYEDEDDDDFIPEPVRRTVTLGRNDLCWCGSGRKYKKCHLESDQKSQPAARPQKQPPPLQHTPEEAELRRRLVDFGTGALRKREMEEALLMFVGSDPPAGAEDDSLAREALDWTLHDYVPPRLGHTLIEDFLKRSPGGLTLRQRKILEGWSRARFSVFEVQEVREGSGVRLKDLLAGGEFFVNDVNSAMWAEPWDCLLARIEELGERYIFTAIVLTVPEHLVEPLKQWGIGAHQRSGLEWDAFLHANSHKLRQEYSRLFSRDAGPTHVVSYEGDELVFSKARYAVTDEDAVRREFDRCKVLLQGEDPADYGWLDEREDENGGRRAYGHIHIAGGELTLECHSRPRLARGKELLSSLAGEHLRLVEDSFTPWQSSMRDRKG
jgi:hypothetical protein